MAHSLEGLWEHYKVIMLAEGIMMPAGPSDVQGKIVVDRLLGALLPQAGNFPSLSLSFLTCQNAGY